MQNDNEVKQLARCGDKSQKEARTVTFGILGYSAAILSVICLNYQRTANFQAYFIEIWLLNTFCMPWYKVEKKSYVLGQKTTFYINSFSQVECMKIISYKSFHSLT